MNIIFFGLSEGSLFETKKLVDEVLAFLTGSDVPLKDLHRL